MRAGDDYDGYEGMRLEFHILMSCEARICFDDCIDVVHRTGTMLKLFQKDEQVVLFFNQGRFWLPGALISLNRFPIS